MFRPRVLVALAVLLAACGDAITPPTAVDPVRPPTHPTATVAPGFAFLPPLIPSEPQAGGSDGTLEPVVIVCELEGTGAAATCGRPVIGFSLAQSSDGGPTLTYDAANQRYAVDWRTDRCVGDACPLDPARTYRIQAWVGSALLGEVDLRVVADASGMASASPNHVTVIRGETLPIRFRVAPGAVSVVQEGQSAPVAAEGGTVTTSDSEVSLQFPAGAVSGQVAVQVTTVEPPVPAVSPWSHTIHLGPSGTQFSQPVTLTIAVDAEQLPRGVAMSDLRVFRLQSDGWAEVPGSRASDVEDVISVEITSFSYYSVQIPVNSISGEPKRTVLQVGETATIGAVATYYHTIPRTECTYRIFRGSSCWTEVDTFVYPGAHTTVEWTSSDTGVISLAGSTSITGADGRTEAPTATAHAAGTATITARIGSGHSNVATFELTVEDPCGVQALAAGTTQGEITAGGCRDTDGVGVAFYAVDPAPAGQVMAFSYQSTLAGSIGLRDANDDPFAGFVRFALALGTGGTMRMISNGDPLQLYVRGSNPEAAGSYSITRTDQPLTPACGTQFGMMAGSTFETNLTAANSCSVAIVFGAPEVVGRTILTHNYFARLEAGKSYTITVTPLPGALRPTLSVFSGGQLVAQSLTEGSTAPRSVTFTATANAYFQVEISSGLFINGTWTNPEGPYRLSVTR